MRFIFRPLTGLAAAVIVAALTLAPMTGWADQARPRGGGGGQSGGRSSGGSDGSGGSGGSHQRSGGGDRVGTAVPRGDGGSRSGGSSGDGGSRPAPTGTAVSGSGGDSTREGSDGDNTGSRPRDGRPVVGRAVPRRGGSGSGGGTTIIVPGGYYGGYVPWAWGGLGFGSYGGYYDPWFYGDPGYYQPYGDEGALRLKVKPRDASVFVDGYFAGQVDDFDGVFQRLKLEPGPHRIEISADGYEPLSFEIRVLPDRTITYKGELNRIQ